MAYSNAIFHIDLYNGNDGVRPTLSNATAANNGSGGTRITYNNHGLVTGAVVTLSLFSAWLNGVFKITVINANSFDLDNTPWQTTADNIGNIVPFGGSSWADAWKTFNAGPTAARTQAGDKVKVCKTSDPISIGLATWTNGSKEVVLATAQTKTIDNCENLWTAANANVQVTRDATRRQGSYAAKLNILTAFTTGKIGYYTLPSTLNLSAYQELSLWLMVYLSYTANNFYIALCSDATGDVIVDKFYVPVSMYTHYASHTLVKEGGGNLGSNINSIAVYATSDPGALYLMLDNIIACKTGGLNLNHIISKNGQVQGGDEPYWFIESINENIITLGCDPYANTTPWYGYTETTETVETYMRMPFKVLNNLNANQVLNTIQKAGVEYEFGYDTLTNNLSGETFLGTVNSQTTAFDIKESTIFSGYFNLVAFNYGITTSAMVRYCNIKIHGLISIKYQGIMVTNQSYYNIFNVDYCTSSYSVVGISSSFRNVIISRLVTTSRDAAFSFLSTSEFNELILGVVKNTGSNISILFQGSNNKIYGGEIDKPLSNNIGVNSVFNTRYFNDVTSVMFGSYDSGAELRWINRKGNNEHEVFKPTGMVEYWQPIVKYLDESGSIEIKATSNPSYSESFPCKFKIAEVNFEAGSIVTLTTHIKKTHATTIQAQLCIGYNPIVGINQDIKSTKSNDTDWEEISIQFTPTLKGVAEVYIYAWSFGNTTLYINVGKLEAIQA